jgi:hypothetical protein
MLLNQHRPLAALTRTSSGSGGKQRVVSHVRAHLLVHTYITQTLWTLYFGLLTLVGVPLLALAALGLGAYKTAHDWVCTRLA